MLSDFSLCKFQHLSRFPRSGKFAGGKVLKLPWETFYHVFSKRKGKIDLLDFLNFFVKFFNTRFARVGKYMDKVCKTSKKSGKCWQKVSTQHPSIRRVKLASPFLECVWKAWNLTLVHVLTHFFPFRKRLLLHCWQRDWQLHTGEITLFDLTIKQDVVLPREKACITLQQG